MILLSALVGISCLLLMIFLPIPNAPTGSVYDNRLQEGFQSRKNRFYIQFVCLAVGMMLAFQVMAFFMKLDMIRSERSPTETQSMQVDQGASLRNM